MVETDETNFSPAVQLKYFLLSCLPQRCNSQLISDRKLILQTAKTLCIYSILAIWIQTNTTIEHLAFIYLLSYKMFRPFHRTIIRNETQVRKLTHMEEASHSQLAW